jgi:probable addiction module antidote protein
LKRVGSVNFTKFDIIDYLDSEQAINAYITLVLDENDPDQLLEALRDVARARGMSRIAEHSGLGRESLYKALSPGAKPRFDTILKVMRALGIRLKAEAI